MAHCYPPGLGYDKYGADRDEEGLRQSASMPVDDCFSTDRLFGAGIPVRVCCFPLPRPRAPLLLPLRERWCCSGTVFLFPKVIYCYGIVFFVLQQVGCSGTNRTVPTGLPRLQLPAGAAPRGSAGVLPSSGGGVPDRCGRLRRFQGSGSGREAQENRARCVARAGRAQAATSKRRRDRPRDRRGRA